MNFLRSSPPQDSYKKVFWKYAENVQDNNHVKVQSQHWNYTCEWVFSCKFGT